MLLYVLRHGKAGEGFPDAVRELTERGRHEVADVVCLRAADIHARQILHSPLVRARQTAELVQQSLPEALLMEESDLIRPESGVDAFCDYLAAQNSAVLICSHNPFVADLVSYLSGRLVAMPAAALAAMEFATPARGTARLLWLETP